jgi:hypothetical protein
VESTAARPGPHPFSLPSDEREPSLGAGAAIDQTAWGAATEGWHYDLEDQCEDEGGQCEGEGDHDEREPDEGDSVPTYTGDVDGSLSQTSIVSYL